VYLVNLEIEDQNIKTRQAVLKQIHLKDALALEKAKNEIDVMVTISQQYADVKLAVNSTLRFTFVTETTYWT
jgi:hypothetical protein